ncbi:ftsK/SpoIIIE family protein [Orientia tsutsugamushi str. TA763]|nr:ftsK/SpoIIIE family protein [Orientia tsutsugamushi str. TA763]
MLLAALPMQLVEQGPKGILGQKTSGVGVALSSLGRGIKTVSVESKVLLPIIGEWKGDLSSPGMLLAGRRGQIMYWSPFGGALLPALNKHGVAPNENFNLCIAGVPGSGKSVFMQELMLSVLGVGGKVFVLDYGRSFKRTCLILGGRYIEFDMKNPVSINPFSEVPEDDSAKSIEARSDFLSNFPSILATMAAPQYGTSDLQQPMLQRALISVWQKNGAKAEITDIADWLSNREESYAKELGNMLFPFTKDGQHGRFFSGKAQLSLNSDIVVIETDHLRSVPELLAVIVQIMIVHINQTMVKGDRSRPFLIMIDEAWKLLAGKRSGEFIEEAGRIARKYNGSIALATQQLTDYFRQEGSASEKAFENSSHKIILKQNSESFKAMRANPKLAGFVDEDWKLNLLQSVHSNPPYYSEIAIYSPNVSGVVGRLMIDPFTLLLTSTNARDYQAIEDHMAKGMNVSEAINYVIRERKIIP